jgi:hypothetical protein
MSLGLSGQVMPIALPVTQFVGRMFFMTIKFTAFAPFGQTIPAAS